MLTRNHWLGLGAGILAGAFWGLVFLTPELTRGFTPIQLSAGRYLAYGAIAAALLARGWRALARSLSWREWRTLAWLGFAGNIIYYVFLANAVQLGGVAMTSLIIGLLPVTVTLAGRRDVDAAPMLRLLPSLALGVAGLVCISWQSLSAPQHGSMQASLLGLLCAVGALVSWTLYAVGNSRALARLKDISAHDWSLLVGVVTGAQALLLAVPAFILHPGAHASSAWLFFGGLVTTVAVLCSVVGNALWNHASRLLPLTMTGQMIVFETLFALLYGFIWEQRLPTGLEWLAMALLVAGVLSCATAHRERSVAEPALNT
ncbi:multidrug DMT transporter permease [Massilia sp. WF1]|uniref:DMT family transporter n=1 Tax=unclassified Massilia TaxID=2609279 RepID=UPI00064A64B9|nr:MULTISPECIES: DMT family transporter [unclassified Massilia]ALK97847.1 multidrug DMT transporter permease [Massilia sp. WG5]KLU35807.1 multidrug DMT transporter permease [Massilia sp. WF1]